MYIESVPNRNSPPAVLLRESYRELADQEAHARQPDPLAARAGRGAAHAAAGRHRRGAAATSRLTLLRALPHGHVAAVLGMARKLDLPRLLLGRSREGAARWRDLALAMIVNRIIAPGSKLATVRALAPETAISS